MKRENYAHMAQLYPVGDGMIIDCIVHAKLWIEVEIKNSELISGNEKSIVSLNKLQENF